MCKKMKKLCLVKNTETVVRKFQNSKISPSRAQNTCSTTASRVPKMYIATSAPTRILKLYRCIVPAANTEIRFFGTVKVILLCAADCVRASGRRRANIYESYSGRGEENSAGKRD